LEKVGWGVSERRCVSNTNSKCGACCAMLFIFIRPQNKREGRRKRGSCASGRNTNQWVNANANERTLWSTGGALGSKGKHLSLRTHRCTIVWKAKRKHAWRRDQTSTGKNVMLSYLREESPPKQKKIQQGGYAQQSMKMEKVQSIYRRRTSKKILRLGGAASKEEKNRSQRENKQTKKQQQGWL
jgi:hypothetical protein